MWHALQRYKSDLGGQDDNGSQCLLLTVEGSIVLRSVSHSPTVNSVEEEERGKSLTLMLATKFFTTKIFDTFAKFCLAAIKARLISHTVYGYLTTH